MSHTTSNTTINQGSCAYYRTMRGSPLRPRSCYDCVNYEIYDIGKNPQDCVVDTNGKCIDRHSLVSPHILAQRNRTYCELDDAVCNACLANKKADELGFCAGTDNCYCTAPCAAGVYNEVDSDVDGMPAHFYVAIVVAVLLGLMLVCWRSSRISLRCRKNKPTYQDVGSGYDANAYHQPLGAANSHTPGPNSGVYYANGVAYHQQQPPNASAAYVNSVPYHVPPPVGNNAINYVNSVPYQHQHQLQQQPHDAYYAANAQVSVPSRYAVV